MKYVIDESLAKAILEYLITRPYIEVANLIQSIHLLQPAEIVSEQEVTNESEKK